MYSEVGKIMSGVGTARSVTASLYNVSCQLNGLECATILEMRLTSPTAASRLRRRWLQPRLHQSSAATAPGKGKGWEEGGDRRDSVDGRIQRGAPQIRRGGSHRIRPGHARRRFGGRWRRSVGGRVACARTPWLRLERARVAGAQTPRLRLEPARGGGRLVREGGGRNGEEKCSEPAEMRRGSR